MGKPDKIYGRPKLGVKCPECGEENGSDRVKADNIEEDDQGRDVLYFTCPDCGKAVRSLIRRMGWE